MDLGLVSAVVMLVIWIGATITIEVPGWIHILLTAGVFLLIYRIVARGTPAARPPRQG